MKTVNIFLPESDDVTVNIMPESFNDSGFEEFLAQVGEVIADPAVKAPEPKIAVKAEKPPEK